MRVDSITADHFHATQAAARTARPQVDAHRPGESAESRETAKPLTVRPDVVEKMLSDSDAAFSAYRSQHPGGIGKLLDVLG